MRAVIATLLALSAGVWGVQLAWRAVYAEQAAAPCTDALAAYLHEHWECSNIRYLRGDITLMCWGGDIAVRDMITSAETKKYTSFMYTNLRTEQQGVCDCDKPFGKACETLE